MELLIAAPVFVALLSPGLYPGAWWVASVRSPVWRGAFGPLSMTGLDCRFAVTVRAVASTSMGGNTAKSQHAGCILLSLGAAALALLSLVLLVD